MALKGRGRPARNDGSTKNLQYRLRLSTDEMYMLDKLSYQLGMSKADILRKGLRTLDNLNNFGEK